MDDSIELLRSLPTRENNRDWNLFTPFWEATRQNELKVQECIVTKKKVWPPRFLSPHEPGANLKWVHIKNVGTVFTFSIVYRAFTPYYQDKIPHALVVVELEDGVRMLGNLVGMDPTKVHCGMEVEAAFDKVNDEVTLVNWKPRERSLS